MKKLSDRPSPEQTLYLADYSGSHARTFAQTLEVRRVNDMEGRRER
jgi:hypothetical protein